jgi:hypothetical protein
VPTIGPRSDHGSDEIPASHHDLVQCPPVAALTTVTPDGYPQTSVVWCDFDGCSGCGVGDADRRQGREGNRTQAASVRAIRAIRAGCWRSSGRSSSDRTWP